MTKSFEHILSEDAKLAILSISLEKPGHFWQVFLSDKM
jgi:hypothetical protein